VASGYKKGTVALHKPPKKYGDPDTPINMVELERFSSGMSLVDELRAEEEKIDSSRGSVDSRNLSGSKKGGELSPTRISDLDFSISR